MIEKVSTTTVEAKEFSQSQVASLEIIKWSLDNNRYVKIVMHAVKGKS